MRHELTCEQKKIVAAFEEVFGEGTFSSVDNILNGLSTFDDALHYELRRQEHVATQDIRDFKEAHGL